MHFKNLLVGEEYVSLIMHWSLIIIAIILLIIKVPDNKRKYLTLSRMQIIIIRHLLPMFWAENKQRLTLLDQQMQFAQQLTGASVFYFFMLHLHL